MLSRFFDAAMHLGLLIITVNVLRGQPVSDGLIWIVVISTVLYVVVENQKE